MTARSHSKFLSEILPLGSSNTGYTAHFVRPNRLSPASHSREPLYEIPNLLKKQRTLL